jgi:hypothetical protein
MAPMEQQGPSYSVTQMKAVVRRHAWLRPRYERSSNEAQFYLLQKIDGRL